MKNSLIALAFGTLSLGISEFVMMGILPNVAQSLGVSIPEAGHCISAYAIGVCVGAPLTTLIAFRRPLKSILLALFVVYLIGNLMASQSTSYAMLIVARFISGLPHGAYFGVGSIVAECLSERGKSSGAIAIMVSGMTIANVIGVPVGTMLANTVSWRIIFLISTTCGVATLLAIYKFVPRIAPLPDTGVRGQFRFLGHLTALLVIGATMFGNGGIFCWYSYISPQMQQLGGFPASAMTALMVVAGVGMCCGNFLGGRLADMHSPAKVDLAIQIVIVAALVATFFCAHIAWLSVVLMFLCTGCLFAVSSPQQSLILQVSYGGKMMAAAFIQIAFNLGNAVGAYIGGLPIDAGLGYRFPALFGAGITMFGIVCLVVFLRHQKQR